MAGHLFVVRGDVRRLARDAWLMPCDADGKPSPEWLLPDQPAPRLARLPAGWREGRERAAEAEGGDGPRVWLVNMDADDSDAGWFLDGVRRFLKQAATALKKGKSRTGRSKPLVAVPVVGGGRDRDPGLAGAVMAELPGLLREAAREYDLDVVLVAHDGAALSAAQAARLRPGQPDPWPELPEELRRCAEELAGFARRGELALFIGAGVSASAGMPLWGALLDKLAERAGIPDAEREALGRLNRLDQAAVIEKRFGGPRRMQEAVREMFTGDRYSLTHALLAALPVTEAVTTNYDRLFETARAALGCEPSVLPYDIRPGRGGWVLKLHGCVSHPEDVVLTRSDLLDAGEKRAALAGVVQALLITRHMLFVGFSLSDDDFHRIADEVRRVVRKSAANGETKPFGTALVLERSPLLEELWGRDLEWAGMSGPDAPKDGGAARRLEIFLDCLLAKTRDAAHLLDPRYANLLTPEESSLRDALTKLGGRPPAALRDSPAWEPVGRALRRLGFGGPDGREE